MTGPAGPKLTSPRQYRKNALPFGQATELAAHIDFYATSEQLEGACASLTVAMRHKCGAADRLQGEYGHPPIQMNVNGLPKLFEQSNKSTARFARVEPTAKIGWLEQHVAGGITTRLTRKPGL